MCRGLTDLHFPFAAYHTKQVNSWLTLIEAVEHLSFWLSKSLTSHENASGCMRCQCKGRDGLFVAPPEAQKRWKTIWQSDRGFDVPYIFLNGSANNHSFTKLMLPAKPLEHTTTVSSPYKPSRSTTFIPDPHLIKIRNSAFNSGSVPEHTRLMKKMANQWFGTTG